MKKVNNIITKYPVIKHLLVMLGITVGIFFVVMFIVKIYARQGKEYELPELVGTTLSDAESNNTLHLRFIVTDSIYDPDSESSMILSQDPLPGTPVKKERQVYVTIASAKPEAVVMPDLIDMSLRQAVSQIISDGLQIGKLRFVESQYRNAIQGQSINGHPVHAGQKIECGSVIDLTVGRGTSYEGTIVPVLTGKTREQCRRSVFSSSLNIVEHFDPGTSNKASAKVYRQDPICSDVKYPLGSAVEVWYCAPSKYETARIDAEREQDSLRQIEAEIQYQLNHPESTEPLYSDDELIW